jgi:hypothetical protein
MFFSSYYGRFAAAHFISKYSRAKLTKLLLSVYNAGEELASPALDQPESSFSCNRIQKQLSQAFHPKTSIHTLMQLADLNRFSDHLFVRWLF